MILRIAVVIPTFNNSRTISETVQDVLRDTPFPVLIIDDGSETPVANVLYSWDVRQALEAGRVRTLRFENNRGKGAALQFAVNELAREGYTHMLTMDGDGQHFAREIRKLVEVAVNHPWDLVIGDRKLKASAAPKVSKFGRAFSNFWVSYQTGLQVKDSQSGFRLYPLLPVQTLRFLTRRYDFEIEVLIRLIWRGVGVREVDIDVYYPAKTERVSHFHKLWDNVRISALNFLLVVVSLLKTHGSPGELAFALGIGVFIGCTPFYGFHLALIALVAFLFRLNLVIMWIGSHVSTPILAPFLVLLEEQIGKNWLNIAPDGEGMEGHFYQILCGSAVLGTLLAVATMVVTFVTALYFKKRKVRTNWSGKTRGGRIGNGFLKLVLSRLGRQYGYLCLWFIVPYFYVFAPKARRGLNEYWRLVKPRATWRERQAAHSAPFLPLRAGINGSRGTGVPSD